MKIRDAILMSALIVLGHQNRALFLNGNSAIDSKGEKVSPPEKIFLRAPALPQYELAPKESNIFQQISNWLSPPSSYSEAKRLMRAATCEDAFVRAVRMAINPRHSGECNLGQVSDIFDYLYQNKVPLKDPVSREYFTSPLEYWKEHRGDCDDMAICMAVAANAVGLLSRIVLANGDPAGHAYAEICLGKDVVSFKKYITARYNLLHTNQVRFYRDEAGFQWLNLDLNNAYPGGEYFDGERLFYYYTSEKQWTDFPLRN